MSGRAEDKHRGRIQAQGGGFESSESWSQNSPLSVSDGLHLLWSLIRKIPKPEFLKRKSEFEKAENFIRLAGEKGGVDARVSKTFKAKGTKDIRVDIEVIKGTAFVKDSKKQKDGF